MLPYVLPMCDIPLYRDTYKASRVRPRTGPQGQYQDLQGRGLYPQGQGLGPSKPRSGIFKAKDWTPRPRLGPSRPRWGIFKAKDWTPRPRSRTPRPRTVPSRQRLEIVPLKGSHLQGFSWSSSGVLWLSQLNLVGLCVCAADHIGAELEENLGAIEEVTGYVKIVRSYALLSLRFLKSLSVIGGERLYENRCVS